MRLGVLTASLVLAAGLVGEFASVPLAYAEPSDPVGQARAAYDRGAAAYDLHKYADAAAEFARADELAPNDTTLALALTASMRAEDPVLGMTLAARAERPGASKALSETADTARTKFASRIGRLRIECEAPACAAEEDGSPIATGSSLWATVGDHVVVLIIGDNRERHPVQINAGAIAVVVPFPPSPAAGAVGPPPSKGGSDTSGAHRQGASGLSPTWVWAGAGLSAALGGLSLVSGLDTASQHDAFVRAPTPEGQSDGRAAQTRTNVLLGAAVFAVLATTVVAIVFVRWAPGPSSTRARAGARAPVVVGGGGF